MTAVISVCIFFKNLSELVTFCAAILILNMEKTCFQHIMLYYVKKGKNATEMQRKICAVYGEVSVSDGTCQKWSGKFLGTTDILAK